MGFMGKACLEVGLQGEGSGKAGKTLELMESQGGPTKTHRPSLAERSDTDSQPSSASPVSTPHPWIDCRIGQTSEKVRELLCYWNPAPHATLLPKLLRS